VRAGLHEIASTADSRFARTLELVNKTNQFNTASAGHCRNSPGFSDGGRCFVLDVTDRYTPTALSGYCWSAAMRSANS
jgi:hypothetical protein